jgi:hypothetical protein
MNRLNLTFQATVNLKLNSQIQCYFGCSSGLPILSKRDVFFKMRLMFDVMFDANINFIVLLTSLGD